MQSSLQFWGLSLRSQEQLHDPEQGITCCSHLELVEERSGTRFFSHRRAGDAYLLVPPPLLASDSWRTRPGTIAHTLTLPDDAEVTLDAMLVTRVAGSWIFVKDPWCATDILPVYVHADVERWWSVEVTGTTQTIDGQRVVVAADVRLYMCANDRPFIMMPKSLYEPRQWPYMRDLTATSAPSAMEDIPPLPGEEELVSDPPSVPPAVGTIGYAKWYGGSVSVTGKVVSAVFFLPDSTSIAYFYIQEPGGFTTPGPVGGIKVRKETYPTGLAAGDVVDVSGTASEDSGGEYRIAATSITITSAATIPAPVFVPQRWTACAAYGLQPALSPDPTASPAIPGCGLGPVGCRVRVCGKVTWVKTDRTECCIDDGSNLTSGVGGSGIRVLYSTPHKCPTAFVTDYYVAEGITGVLGAEKVDGVPVPVIRVPSNVIFVKPTGSDSDDGLSWDTALLTVQAGINAAAAMQPAGEVWVAAGTYYETITLANGVAVYGGFAGAETARDDRHPATNVTTLDGGWTGSVVTATNVGAGARIDGFTITNGGYYSIYTSGGSPSIVGNTITQSYYGIYCSGSTAAICGNTFSDCTTAVYCCDSADAAVSRNKISTCDMGVYFNEASGSVKSNFVTGKNLTAEVNAGIYVYGCSPLVANNTVTWFTYAGIDVEGDSSPIVANNIVANGGSGLSAYFPASPTLRNNDSCDNSVNYYGVSGNMTVAPGFLEDGLHIDVTSPCAGAGDNSVVEIDETDIDGDPRIMPTLGRVDIGADETDNCRWLAVNASAQASPIGGSIDITATLTDDHNSAVAGKTIAFTVAQGSGTLTATADTTDSNGNAHTELSSVTPGHVTIKASVSDECGHTLQASVRVAFYDPNSVDIFFCLDCTRSMWGDSADHGAQASVCEFLEEMSSTYGIQFRVGGVKFNNPYSDSASDSLERDISGNFTPRVFTSLDSFTTLTAAEGWVNNGYKPVGGDDPELQLDALHYAALDMAANALSPHKYIVLLTDHPYHDRFDYDSIYTATGVADDLDATDCPVYISLWENPVYPWLDSYYDDLLVNTGAFDPCDYYATGMADKYPLAVLWARILADL
jgi:hypothetical protein